jgi:hypothetical protein
LNFFLHIIIAHDDKFYDSFFFKQIMEVPSLLEEGSNAVKRNMILKQKQDHQAPPGGGGGGSGGSGGCCL